MFIALPLQCENEVDESRTTQPQLGATPRNMEAQSSGVEPVGNDPEASGAWSKYLCLERHEVRSGGHVCGCRGRVPLGRAAATEIVLASSLDEEGKYTLARQVR